MNDQMILGLFKNLKSQGKLEEFVMNEEFRNMLIKELLRLGYEELIRIEFDEELGYEKWSRKGEKTNYRNGTRKSKSM